MSVSDRGAPTMAPETMRAAATSSRRVIVSIVLSIACLIGGYAAFLGLLTLRSEPALREFPQKTYVVDAYRVEAADLQEVISGYGSAKPVREVTVAAQVSGAVTEVVQPFKPGRAVSGAAPDDEGVKGELLVHIDPRSYRERLSQMETQLADDRGKLELWDQDVENVRQLIEKSVADLADAEQEFKKTRELRAKNIANDSDFRRSQMEVRQYERALVELRNREALLPIQRRQLQRATEGHESDYALAKLDLERTQVWAPFSGWISRTYVEQGQFVRAGDPLLQLIDSTAVEIAVSITSDAYDRLLPLIRSGTPPIVELASDERSEPRWQGVVARAAPNADELSRTVAVYVRVDNSTESPLLPGTFVHARILGPIWERAVTLPRTAAPRGRLLVVNEGRAESREMHATRAARRLAETDSLQPGDLLILSNLDSISPGDAIRVRAEQTLDELLALDPHLGLRRPSQPSP